ncbi:prolyl aminopeptidase [Granulosicoccaceae sp. 1_MG-2023]|nr:prolyl aminopeptidase [Granulosicoccaceae sp. 1_MG-2023]
MSSLFPALQPYSTRMLEVDDRHSLYVEESGNPDGLPVVFLHGGPGGGSSPFMRRLFDPQVYRIVLFDQRGCGQSRPHAELTDNTTAHLVADMEQIRAALGIDKWVVAGGSWGSTLALAYAVAHPQQVSGLILRGIFLGGRAEIDWLYGGGAGAFFPEHWAAFRDEIPADAQDNLLQAYHRRLVGDNEIGRLRAAKAWSLWEGHLSTLLPSQSLLSSFTEPHKALSMARIETDYFVNDCYLAEGELLQKASRLAGIPGYIVHGRYDMVCRVQAAYALHQAWPDSQLFVVQAAGHSASEPGITAALLDSAHQLARRLKAG